MPSAATRVYAARKDARSQPPKHARSHPAVRGRSVCVGTLVGALSALVACGGAGSPRDGDLTADGAIADGAAQRDAAALDGAVWFDGAMVDFADAEVRLDAHIVDASGFVEADVADAGMDPVDEGGADAPIRSVSGRGYWTTAEELREAGMRAERSEQPWAEARRAVLSTAGAPGAFSYGSLDGDVRCGGESGRDPSEPAYIAHDGGGRVLLAKAYSYILQDDDAYAEEVRTRLLDLTDTTGWGGETFSGANQCILNLSWFVPRLIQAADLLEAYAGWTAADRNRFQRWLATEVYPKTSWASDARANNWGAAGSHTSAAIADYLASGTIGTLRERDGTTRTLRQAWRHHLDRQLARMNGTARMDAQCEPLGIQTHGGIPEELRRGSSGCNATYIHEMDSAYLYHHTVIQSYVGHAELLLRRGDSKLYDNVATDGRGSIRQAMRFVFANPTQSWPWSTSHHATLEIAYRYYRDPDMCRELRCSNAPDRVVARNNGVFSFTSLTHAFQAGQQPAPLPVVPPP